jgi:undecaprenyl-diphosphatase
VCRKEIPGISAIESYFLGLVQGLTEFLPISSSGHLVIFQTILGIEGTTFFFDLLLHFGTLGAVVVVYRRDFIQLMRRLYSWKTPSDKGEEESRKPWYLDEDLRLWAMIITGSVPTFILAFLFHVPVEKAFHSSKVVGISLLLSGFLLVLTRWIKGEGRGAQRMRIVDALVIGTAQGIAVVPGISRSGITIVAGLVMGLKGDVAARFSFLLSVPAIVGAIVFKIWHQGGLNGSFGFTIELIGCVTAFFTGILAMKAVIGLVNSGRLYVFSFYCITLGLLVVYYSWG